MTPRMDQCCCKCYYYEQVPKPEDPDIGRCHRYAPKPAVEIYKLPPDNMMRFVRWPAVHSTDDWCGEFREMDA